MMNSRRNICLVKWGKMVIFLYLAVASINVAELQEGTHFSKNEVLDDQWIVAIQQKFILMKWHLMQQNEPRKMRIFLHFHTSFLGVFSQKCFYFFEDWRNMWIGWCFCIRATIGTLWRSCYKTKWALSPSFCTDQNPSNCFLRPWGFGHFHFMDFMVFHELWQFVQL